MSPQATITRPRATRYRRRNHGQYWQELEARRTKVAATLGFLVIVDVEPVEDITLLPNERKLVRRGRRLHQLMEAVWQQYKREQGWSGVCDDRR